MDVKKPILIKDIPNHLGKGNPFKELYIKV